MTDARVTQAPALALYEADSDVRVTQLVSLALHEADSDVRVTQLVSLALYEQSPEMRVTQGAALALHSVFPDMRVTQAVVLCLYADFECVTSTAQCWKITRTDGAVYAYTTHDKDIITMGLTFKRCESLRASAAGQSAVVGTNGAGDIEAVGIVDDDEISDADLYRGLFDGAVVEIFEVNWQSPTKYRRLTRGVVQKVEHGGASYKLTVTTPALRLTQQPLLTTYSPACRHVFGDANCGIDLGPLTVSGAVTTVYARENVNQVTYRKFADVVRTEAADYFVGGVITWTSGNNVGVSSEVKSFSDTEFELWDILPYEIALLDEYTLTPGCPKTTTACKTKWGSSNILNFGGFPAMPGTDVLYQTPDAKT